MIFEDDIADEINADFGERANAAVKILKDEILEKEQLYTNRIIRCIIYLAKGNLTDLENYIKAATIDPRDVIFWAEYTGIEQKKVPEHVRDFTKTFDEALKTSKNK